MDTPLNQVMELRARRTVEALERNRMTACFVESRGAAREKVLSLLPAGCVVTHGGSMTLEECAIPGALRSGDYQYLDRAAPGLTPEDIAELYRRAFSADAYLGSCNAVTEAGELFNVDGNGNRVAAYLYGPKRVILVVGWNKIVPDLGAAVQRLCHTAAPANGARLRVPTPCSVTGVCSDCRAPERMCCDYVVQGFQRQAGRVHVIVVGESLGY